MAWKLKTQEHLEADLRKAAQMIKDKSRELHGDDSPIAHASIEDIVAILRAKQALRLGSKH